MFFPVGATAVDATNTTALNFEMQQHFEQKINNQITTTL